MTRTMAEIEQRYEADRQAKLDRINNGEVSASMSGIEYHPKPWGELDVNNPSDLQIISLTLSWDGSKHIFKTIEHNKKAKAALPCYKKLHSQRKDDGEPVTYRTLGTVKIVKS